MGEQLKGQLQFGSSLLVSLSDEFLLAASSLGCESDEGF
jgi:hypothetical protein